jgi:hypothetical protein
MESIPETTDKKVTRYFLFYSFRAKGKPEEYIVSKLGAESAAQLYQQLRRDGFPVCGTCGDYSVDGEHCAGVEGKRRRRARTTGEVIELPPAAEAAGLFRSAIEGALSEIDGLSHLNEILQGERFIGVASEPWQKTYYFNRKLKDISEDEWEQFCRELGEDHAQEEFEVRTTTGFTPHGASQTPTEPLTTLIAVYALIGRYLEPDEIQALVESLHPDPQSIDEKRLQQALKDLRARAGDVAKLVRGGKIRRGPSTEELSLRYAQAAFWIAVYRQQEEAESHIDQFLIKEGYTKDEISWLKSLRLSVPLALE